jgi:ATP-binding cassette, subfamily B, bacterial
VSPRRVAVVNEDEGVIPTFVTEGTQGAWNTLVRGLKLSPELRDGLLVTILLAIVATAGRVVVPVAVQLTIDEGIRGGVDDQVATVARYVGLAFLAVVATGIAGYFMHLRLATMTETALSNLRVRAFRHIHDLSVLHQSAENRGALVSRVTSDVDTISRFMQWGGLVLLISLGQLVVTTAVMAYYSWQLTLVVLVSIGPLVYVLRRFQRHLSKAYDAVRQRIGEMLTAFSESVMGASVIRAYNIEDRTNRRVVDRVDRYFDAQYRAGKISAFMFSSGDVFTAVATAAVVVVGVLLGVGGELSEGRVVAFLFLVSLFVDPVQIATEVLDQIQTAIAGWRRILNVLDTPSDIADPGEEGRDLPEGPISVRFERVDFRYPTGPMVLSDIDVEVPAQARIAIVGETGSGKTTFAKLLTRLVDPTAGRIYLSGVPLDEVRFESLRERVIMVPQDDFLFDTSIEENVRYGRPSVDDEEIRLAFIELGLTDWVEQLPRGLQTRAGERGEYLSVGERQLVSLVRAWVANPDLLVLDEATSAVDPATEVRLQRALEGLTRGRTSITIAHRLATAAASDEVLVFDEGRIVERGHHDELVGQGAVYSDLWASWTAAGRVG